MDQRLGPHSSSSSSSGLPWSLFLAFNPSCPSSWSGRWLDTGGGAGRRGRCRAGRKEERGTRKKGKLGWAARRPSGAGSFALLSQNCLEGGLGGGGKKEETAKGRPERGAGEGRGPVYLCLCQAVPLLYVNPSMSQAPRGSSDKLVVSVPAEQMIFEVNNRADRKSWSSP